MTLTKCVLLAVFCVDAFGAYTYDYAVTPPANDPAHLQASNATYYASSATFIGGINYIGSISGSNPNDYEVLTTFSIGGPSNGNPSTYAHHLRMSAQGETQVAFGVTNPYQGVYYCSSITIR